MLASQIVHQGSVPYEIVVVMLAVAGVIFWRITLRLIVIALIILILSGAVAFFEGFLHGFK